MVKIKEDKFERMNELKHKNEIRLHNRFKCKVIEIVPLKIDHRLYFADNNKLTIALILQNLFIFTNMYRNCRVITIYHVETKKSKNRN